MIESECGMNTSVRHIITRIVIWIVGIWISLMTIAQIAFSPAVLTKLVNRITSEHLDADIEVGKAQVSFLKHFPKATLIIEDFTICNPDTLAHFDEFSASVRVMPLVIGKIYIPHISLDQPRIHAHRQSDGKANWDFLAIANTDEEENSESGSFPGITIGQISLTGNPHIVYHDHRDTTIATVDVKRINIDGAINTTDLSKNHIAMDMDSLFVRGRIGQDTLALKLDALRISDSKDHMNVQAHAKTFMATRKFGRIRIPIDINGDIFLPKDTVPAVSVKDFVIEIANIPMTANAQVRLLTGRLPDFNASIKMAAASLPHDFLAHDISVGMEATAHTDSTGQVEVNVQRAEVKTAGAALECGISIKDALGNDPLIGIDGKLEACLDSLQKFIPDSLNLTAEGWMKAKIDGNARVSHLNLYNFSRAAITGDMSLSNVHIHSPEDVICVKIDSLGISVGPENKTSTINPSQTFRLLAINGFIDNADVRYYDQIRLKGKELRLSAKNSIPEGDDTTRISHFGGTLSAEFLTIMDSEASSLTLDQTTNRFQLIPKKSQPTLPMLSFSSNNKRIILKTSTNRAILTDSQIKAEAAMNTIDRRIRREAYLDSLGRVYPDIPRDSLFRHMQKIRGQKEIPEWLKEEDFKKSDLDIRLDKALAKYFREWDMKGSVGIRTGIVMTPHFPLRNILRGFECNFNNNEISIDSLKIMTGSSEISAEGKLSGLKRALLGRGIITLDADIRSDRMDANELLRAYNTGAAFNPETATEQMEDASDSEFFKMVTSDTTSTTEQIGMIVVPANLNADIRLNAANITYSDLDISKATAKILMKERCVQITDIRAESNMGEVNLDGFYSSRTKKDLKTGFSLSLVDITAEKVISLMPSIDTLMPLLKSFKGLLNCEIAGTAQLDTNMNIIMPSINGIMRISGENLSISDSELYNTLAKKLLFKNKKQGKIKKMTVEGVIKDNVFEIFPFVLKIDRYTLAMSGVQNLDMSFKYHVSVLKSPFLIKIGIDLQGDNFDKMKFKIGRAKYRNTNVPVYSSVIDETKINLVTSIRQIFEKGVEKAIRENEGQDIIENLKRSRGYINPIYIQLEELSAEEQRQLESDEQADIMAQTSELAQQAIEELRRKEIL